MHTRTRDPLLPNLPLTISFPSSSFFLLREGEQSPISISFNIKNEEQGTCHVIMAQRLKTTKFALRNIAAAYSDSLWLTPLVSIRFGMYRRCASPSHRHHAPNASSLQIKPLKARRNPPPFSSSLLSLRFGENFSSLHA